MALLGVLLLVLMGTVGTVGALSFRSIERDLRTLLEQDARVLTELRTMNVRVLQAQLAVKEAAASTGDDLDLRLQEFDTALDDVVANWANTQRFDHQAVPDEAVFDAWLVAVSRLRAELEFGDQTRSVDETGATFDELSSAFAQGIEPLALGVRATNDTAAARARVAYTLLLVVAGVGLAVGGWVSWSSYRAARAQHRAISRQEDARRREAFRARVESRVSRSLNYARSEDTALEAGERALAQLCSGRASELLLADSSRAHFGVALRTDHEQELPGCRVATPGDCPAIARGRMLQFTTSDDFDACPHLHGRSAGALSAVCVPVSISGMAEGVLHSTGDDGEAADGDVLYTLDVVARRLGERLGELRTFQQSQLQAATDPLTGLANRRSFQNAIAPWLTAGRPLAVAFCDIDHFKQLNDKFGHDSGDRALRSFARLFRDMLRPDDLLCRWGGEEFVVAFADLGAEMAGDILDRVRAELAVLVAGGRLPAFTVSCGVADRDDAETLDGLIEAADRALLTAKRTGRDRVVLAGDPSSRRAPSGSDSPSGPNGWGDATRTDTPSADSASD